MSEHLPAPDINPDDYFCNLCGTGITPGFGDNCDSCDRVLASVIIPLKIRIKALEGVVEAVMGCTHYLEEEGYCEGCDKGHKGQSWHNKWCNIGKLVKALKKLAEV